MIRDLVLALKACAVTFVLCAIAYPAIVWGMDRDTTRRPLRHARRSAPGAGARQAMWCSLPSAASHIVSS